MPTINARRVGFIRGTPSTSLNTARTSNGTTATDGPTTNITNAVQSFFSSGRGGGTILFHRTYVHFDTSAITSTLTSAKLKFTTVTSNSSDVIVMNGIDPFGGDGLSALATSDFNAVNIGGLTQPFSSGVSLSIGAVEISLNASALSLITSNDNTFMCLMNNTFDFGGTTPSSTTSLGIAFGTTMQLEYVEVATSNITSLNTIARSNITSFNTIALASIDEINGIDN